MWTRKTKTVASVMESFLTTITDLQEIIETTQAHNVVLNQQRIALDEKIETNIGEITQARGVEGRLADLLYGPESTGKCCPK